MLCLSWVCLVEFGCREHQKTCQKGEVLFSCLNNVPNIGGKKPISFKTLEAAANCSNNIAHRVTFGCIWLISCWTPG